jgi:hypothetical protein
LLGILWFDSEKGNGKRFVWLDDDDIIGEFKGKEEKTPREISRV